MKTKTYIMLLSFLLSTPVVAYSILWVGAVGEPLQSMTARGMGMGRVSIAIPYHIAELNPACVYLDRTSVSLTGVQETIYSSGAGVDANSHDFRLPELCIAFPLPWAAVVDARYVRGINADFALSRQDTIGGEPYLHELSRDGSIASVTLGLSKGFNPITVGARGCMNFGSFLDEQSIHFESGEYRDSYDQLTRKFNGLSYEIGILYRLAGLFIGGVYCAESEVDSNLTLPPSYGAGISYSTRKALIGLDYTTSLWHRTDEDYDDAHTVAIGCEYALDHSKLRTGYRYSSSYYHQIKEHMVTAGIGFPLGKRNGGFDLAMEVGIRSGSVGDDLKEKFVRIGFTFWRLEEWKRRTSFP